MDKSMKLIMIFMLALIGKSLAQEGRTFGFQPIRGLAQGLGHFLLNSVGDYDNAGYHHHRPNYGGYYSGYGGHHGPGYGPGYGGYLGYGGYRDSHYDYDDY